jgi:hypothetical protein
MRKSTVFAPLLLVLMSALAMAQPDGPPPRGEGRPEGPPPPHPLLVALDADRDGTLSTDEINGAVEALKKLDENNDGQITQEELRPRREGRRGGRGFGNPDEFISRMMERDVDKDGKLTSEELGERGQRMLERGDTNNDGSLDEQELRTAFENFRGRGGRGGNRDENRPERPERPERPAMEE